MGQFNPPHHIAIIPDGNRRWARARGLPTIAGHKAGFDMAVKLARHARRLGIHTLTLWGFSTENWSRQAAEKNYLFKLYIDMTDRYLQEAQKEQVRIVHLGRKDRLPKPLIDKIAQAEQQTRHFERYFLNLAIDYGGQDEIVRTIQKLKNQSITPETIEQSLDTGGQPYPHPDLIIRTSGECRLSGFMLWQCSYSELYFAQCHFPDFNEQQFDLALAEFAKRERRFGGN